MLYIFFFNDTATTEIYTLSLHDALPILVVGPQEGLLQTDCRVDGLNVFDDRLFTDTIEVSAKIRYATPPSSASVSPDTEDRKSTRLNSSHANISYAVFCLKKKKKSTHNW